MANTKDLSNITFAMQPGADMGMVVSNPDEDYVVNAAEIYWGITAANMPKDVDSMPDKITNSGDLIKAIKYAAQAVTVDTLKKLLVQGSNVNIEEKDGKLVISAESSYSYAPTDIVMNWDWSNRNDVTVTRNDKATSFNNLFVSTGKALNISYSQSGTKSKTIGDTDVELFVYPETHVNLKGTVPSTNDGHYTSVTNAQKANKVTVYARPKEFQSGVLSSYFMASFQDNIKTVSSIEWNEWPSVCVYNITEQKWTRQPEVRINYTDTTSKYESADPKNTKIATNPPSIPVNRADINSIITVDKHTDYEAYYQLNGLETPRGKKIIFEDNTEYYVFGDVVKYSYHNNDTRFYYGCSGAFELDNYEAKCDPKAFGYLSNYSESTYIGTVADIIKYSYIGYIGNSWYYKPPVSIETDERNMKYFTLLIPESICKVSYISTGLGQIVPATSCSYEGYGMYVFNNLTVAAGSYIYIY